jgi:hypothetical protein
MKGLRSVLIGMHNPIIHGLLVSFAWKKIYRKVPNLKEALCILLHDIGYIKQDFIDGKDDKHPELGAKICGQLLGKDYYILCITHSRDYAKKLRLPLSKLGYADKYSVLLIPDLIYKPLIYLGGEAQEYHKTTKTKKWGYPINTKLIKADYRKWWLKNGKKI